MNRNLDILAHDLRIIAQLRRVAALLSWDQETYMPEGAGTARADQIAYISGLMHDKLVSANMQSALSELVDLDSGKVLDEKLPDLDRIRLQEICSFGCPSISTTHMRQLPSTERSGCQQKCGIAIPSRRAASMTLVPAATSISCPSIVSLGMSSGPALPR